MLKATLFSIVLISLSTPIKTTITDAERKYLVDFMTKTKHRLLKDVKGLTAAQLNFKPDSTRWSVAECIEHINLTENSNYNRVIEALKAEADPSSVKPARKGLNNTVRFLRGSLSY